MYVNFFEKIMIFFVAETHPAAPSHTVRAKNRADFCLLSGGMMV